MKIIQKIIAVFVFVFATAISNAQTISLVGGLNISKAKIDFGGDVDNKERIGYHAGIAIRCNVQKFTPLAALAIEPSILYTQKGYDRRVLTTSTEYENMNQFNYVQLTVPAMVYVGPKKLNLGVGIGPYAAYAINGTNEQEYNDGTINETDLKFGPDDDDNFKALDYGVALGANIKLLFLNLRLQYDLGMKNINPERYDGSIKNRNFMAAVGISF